LQKGIHKIESAFTRSGKSTKPILEFEVMTESLQNAPAGKVIGDLRLIPKIRHKESIVKKVMGRKPSEDSTSSKKDDVRVIVERVEEEPQVNERVVNIC
jgi:hypothetical protein